MPPAGVEPLPAMVPIDEVRARVQKDELRDFRTYLIERGSVACLTKLYMHLMEKWRCNEDVDLDGVKEFLSRFKDESNPHAVEIEQLEAENSALRAQAAAAEEQCNVIAEEIDFWKRKRLAWRYWMLFQFRYPDRDSLNGMELWTACCGDFIDANTQVQVAKRVAPEFTREDYPGPNLASSSSVRRSTFTKWITTEASPELLEFLMDLVHHFEAQVGEGVQPFQESIVECFCCATHYPVSPDPEKKFVEVLAGLPGAKDSPNSEQGRAWDVFEADIVKCLAEVRAPQAYPTMLLELFIALNEKFGALGDPAPLTEEELAELQDWEPTKPTQAEASPAAEE